MQRKEKKQKQTKNQKTKQKNDNNLEFIKKSIFSIIPWKWGCPVALWVVGRNKICCGNVACIVPDCGICCNWIACADVLIDCVVPPCPGFTYVVNNLKTGVSRKQSTPNFPKNEHFLRPDTHTYVCVSGGKKCSFSGKLDVLCFLGTPVLRFALLPYYRR